MPQEPIDAHRHMAIAHLGKIKESSRSEFVEHYFEVNDLDGPKPGIYKVSFHTGTKVAYCPTDSSSSCRHAAFVFTQINEEIGLENLP